MDPVTIANLVGLLATVVVGLKNSQGQPLVSSTIGTAITAGEGVVTSIIADIQAARSSGVASGNAVTSYLQTIQAILGVLQGQKVLSQNTVAEINSLTASLAAALAAEQAALKNTDPSLLTPIPPAV